MVSFTAIPKAITLPKFEASFFVVVLAQVISQAVTLEVTLKAL